MSNKELTTELQGESLLPKENTFVRRTFPRISFVSQDVTEGKGKSMKVVTEAGTFFTERPTDETDDKGKKIWEKKEIGKELQAVIFFTRKKLSYYDQAAGKFVNSSYFDQDTDMVPLWSDGKEIAKGNKKELQAPYVFTKEDGKQSCKLAENKILYVWYEGEVYELTVKGTSMYEYSAYYKQWNGEPNKNLTLISSIECENGSTLWNKTTYSRVRQLTQDEWDVTRELAAEMLHGIADEKAYFNSINTDVPTSSSAGIDMNEWDPALPSGKNEF